MDRLRDPAISIVLVLLIGVICGFVLHKLMRRSWLAERLGAAGRGLLTFVLVGIAGAFIGFHAAMLTNIATMSPLAPFVAAALLAALVVWGWQKAPS